MDKITLGMVIAAFAVFGIIGYGLSGGTMPEYSTFGGSKVLNSTTPEGFGDMPEYSAENLKLLIHERVNAVRLQHNTTEILFDSNIAVVADAHSLDMFVNQYFDHVDSSGLDSGERGVNAGYTACGDMETRAMMDDFKTRQDENNAERATLNKELFDYNARVIQYNKEITDSRSGRDQIRDFAPNQEITDRVTKQKLDTEGAIMDNERARLENIRSQLDMDYERLKEKSDRIYKGFAENIIQIDLWKSKTIEGDSVTYDWSTEQEKADSVVNGWLNSAGHRQNLLNQYHNVEGIGVYIDRENAKLYVTQNFC